MAAFPYVHPTFLLDSDFLPNTSTIKMCSTTGSLMEESFMTNVNNYFYSYNPSQAPQHFDARASHEGISSVETNSTRSHHSDNEQSQVSEKYKTDSSSMVIEIDGEDQDVHKETQSQNKKRTKSKDSSCLSSGQSKDLKETKAKKQKKCNGRVLKGTDEMKSKADKKNHNGVTEEPPTGYIHVRARRGQATDSHSLAERVRREKISERMKLLQSLVPGCDKVTGKALMLDEIINYVQSLQNQVEFLSMKIASVNPMFYDFGADLEPSVKTEKQSNVVPPLPSTQHSTTPTQLMTSFPDTTTTFTTRNNYHLLEFQQEQRPIPMPQVNENLLLDVDEQRQQMFINQSWLNHLSSFQ